MRLLPDRALFGIVLISICAWGQIDLSGMGISLDAPVQEPVSVEVTRVDTGGADLVVDLLLRMVPEVHVYAAESLFFKVGELAAQGLGPARIELPSPKPYTNFDSSIVGVFVDGQTVRVSRAIVDTAWELTGYLQYQACDETMCFTPRKKWFRIATGGVLDTSAGLAEAVEAEQNRSGGSGTWREALSGFRIEGRAAGFLPVAEFLGFLDNPSGYGGSDILAGKSLGLVIVIVLLGGLALNLTPCVLPMIPVTIAVIGAGAKAGTRRHGFLVGAVYGLGMAISYGALGALVVGSGARFGVINASPSFNLLIAALFVVLALGMFDVVHIDFTRFRSGIRHDTGSAGKLVPVFAMGVVAAVLAGACVAPVLISVLLYSGRLFAEGNYAALGLPFLLGAGMALPWPFAGAGLSFLPKPGGWMVWVKYAFGVVILGIALYYGYTGINLMRGAPEALVEQDADTGTLEWVHSLEEGLARAEAEGRPVLIDFWATWCKNCHVMDAATFRDPAVEKRLAEFILVKYQAEDPESPETKPLLDYFGVLGLPTYVVLTGGVDRDR